MPPAAVARTTVRPEKDRPPVLVLAERADKDAARSPLTGRASRAIINICGDHKGVNLGK
jgi:hypothetical protein